MDPTRPPASHLGVATVSFFCCPFIGAVAVYHAVLSRRTWLAHDARRARAHALMAQKLASTAFFYGVCFLILYLFFT